MLHQRVICSVNYAEVKVPCMLEYLRDEEKGPAGETRRAFVLAPCQFGPDWGLVSAERLCLFQRFLLLYCRIVCQHFPGFFFNR